MGYENDPYMDEDGEPLMDPDAPSDREGSPEPEDPLDDDLGDDWRRERSPTPAYDEDKTGRPRKRLVKKVGRVSPPDRFDSGGLNDLDDDEVAERDEEEASSSKKRKAVSLKEGKEGSWKKEKRKLRPERERERETLGGRGVKAGSKGYGGEEEMKELWDTIAGGDSEVCMLLPD